MVQIGTGSNENPAAVRGWVKSTDPRTGRVFYANHVTRKTQWEAPDDWIEPVNSRNNNEDNVSPPRFSEVDSSNNIINNTNSYNSNNDYHSNNDNEPLPSNWEEMHDPTTGKPFYVDHQRKITTWTRPRPTPKQDTTSSLRPAIDKTNTSSSANTPSLLQDYYNTISQSQTQRSSQSQLSFQQEAAAYSRSNAGSLHSHAHQHHHNDVDFSDTLPSLEFKVHKVADALRPTCAQCATVFSLSKRRHHCRLCGDVFCDACSNHRVTLPLQGPEFEKPVRVCDYCNTDVERGNFFSLRRYLTPLHLCNPSTTTTTSSSTSSSSSSLLKEEQDDEEKNGVVATSRNVNAALSAMTADLDEMVHNPATMNEKVTIPPEILVTEILKHLHQPTTADRAIRAMASLLALESVACTDNDIPAYAVAVYLHGKQTAIDNILLITERSGSDRKTLYVQEQAARTLCYLTEPKVISAVIRQYSELDTTSSYDNKTSTYSDNSNTKESTDKDKDVKRNEEALDIPRTVRNLLDHASSSTRNPNLQRWATACIKNCVLEDRRRACLAVNDVAALVASGQEPSAAVAYESILDQLVQTGGVMILCTLIGSDDADTRAHAVATLAAVLTSTRAINASYKALSEMTGNPTTSATAKDGDILSAIVAGGGCGASVSQLLLSADHTVAAMGCSFLSSLVLPLLSDPNAVSTALPSKYDYRHDQDERTATTRACREAALEIATGSCLPALVALQRESGGGANRPTELRKLGMETLAAVVNSVCQTGAAWSNGNYEEGLMDAPKQVQDAMMHLNQEGVLECAVNVLLVSSSTAQSLGSSTVTETAQSRIREAAGLILGAITSCSAQAILDLQQSRSQQQQQVLSTLLLSSNDTSSVQPSAMRGDGAPRCLGVLETVSAILLFTWQQQQQEEHNSASMASELLDRLIEVLDAGAIPFASRVMSTRIDWDSTQLSNAGAIRARAAVCRFLACLFGIALLDETGIGMRRLMDAVEADASSYRSSSGSTNNNNKSPNNLIQATLATLNTGAQYARRAVTTNASNQSHLNDLVDAALAAVGSMCGSSDAPGNRLMSGEKFLLVPRKGMGGSERNSSSTNSNTNDPYKTRRNEICGVACDIVVRAGGRSGGSALLPSMLVGGLGEGAVKSSLRLTMAIANNGNKDHHAKLAQSGLLVPVCDLLRMAAKQQGGSGNDLYQFSAALQLVRVCGPYIAAGSDGGLESVRDAIRVATTVLTLPINPHSTLTQMETQEALKSECIVVLEALSNNASLWSSISSQALPSIAQYLQTSAALSNNNTFNPKRQRTLCAALRAILQIVKVPSHAVAAADAGLVEPLGKLLKMSQPTTMTALPPPSQDNSTNTDTSTAPDSNEIPMLALEILHMLALNDQARRQARFLDSPVLIRSIGTALGQSATSRPKKPADTRADVTFLGLEILHFILRDITNGKTVQQILQSPQALCFLDNIASEPRFIRSMAATLLLPTEMKVPQPPAEEQTTAAIPLPAETIPDLYGPPLILVPETCAGYKHTHQAALSLLFTLSVYACAIESQRADAFWNSILLESSNDKDVESVRACAAFAAYYLSALTQNNDSGSSNNKNDAPDRLGLQDKDPAKQEFIAMTQPLVRYRLLEALKLSMEQLLSIAKAENSVDYGGDSDDEKQKVHDPYVMALITGFNIPHICLDLWKDPALLDLSFSVIQQMVEQLEEPEDILHLFVQSKEAILSLFDLLNLDNSSSSSSSSTSATTNNASVVERKRFLATVLGQLAESGLLTDAVERLDVRSSAIAALAAACLSEDAAVQQQQQQHHHHASAEHDDDHEQDITSNRLSSVLMRCLVELCSAPSRVGKDEEVAVVTKKITLVPTEAVAIAKNLGQKICHMVLSRFLERAKLQQYDMDHDENILEAPDVMMLCAVAQHTEALQTLMALGGIHALSLVAGEGEISAIVALQKAVMQSDANVLLEGDTYKAMMKLLAASSRTAANVEGEEEQEEGNPVVTKKPPQQLETSAFGLLSRLCSDSIKGRNAVEADEHCLDCVKRAVGIVVSMVIHEEEADEGEEAKRCEDTENEDENRKASDEEEDAQDKAKKVDVVKVPASPKPSELRPASEGDVELAIAACSFLSSLVQAKIGRNTLLGDALAIESLKFLSMNAGLELQFAALQVLMKLASFATVNGAVTASSIAEVVRSVLPKSGNASSKTTSKLPAESNFKGLVNVNRLHMIAVSGLEVVFDALDTELQKELAISVAGLFMKNVKSCIVTKSTTKESDRAFSAELVYGLTLVLQAARGKTSFVDDIFNQDLLTSFLHLTQWRQDPKTTLGNTHQLSWDAAVTNCLLLLSSLLVRPQVALSAAGLDLKTLAGTTLMLARPGKAPRKALDPKSALNKVVQGNDNAAAVAAQRVLDRLY